ncbi:Hypothetical predicted protein [Paramuricea clavata]|uniref:Uncharacterized protein n=1 Tax=Paramuricea clavata TaxID=317549 RepID=A0A6S7LG67_PARCT|nr:Hypothetical predicted protein [Paramuricea clavata]
MLCSSPYHFMIQVRKLRSQPTVRPTVLVQYLLYTLSCAPVPDTNAIDDLNKEIDAFVNVVIKGLPATDTRLEEIKRHQLEDETRQEISKTKLPELPRNLQPVLPHQQHVQEKEETSLVNMKLNFDKHHAAKSLQVLQNGDEVWVQDRKESGKVEGQANSNMSRSYVVKTPTATVRRNRVQINKLPDQDTFIPQSKPPETANQPVPQPVPALNIPKPSEQSAEKRIQTRFERVVKKPARFTV